MTMTDKKKPTTTNPATPLTVATTATPVVLPATVAGTGAVHALATLLRYEGATDPATLENSARECIKRAGMALFEFGGYLLLLRAACAHGEFLPALERLNIEPRSAQRYMKVTQRFAGHKSDTVSHLQGLGVRKLLDMAVLDDEQLEELTELGHTGELALDDAATMSVKELRAAVREAKQERQAQEDLLAAKSKQIDALKLKTKRIQAAPPDEVLADLKKEATALANDAQGLVMGGLRQAVLAIAAHGEDGAQAHRAFLAGLLAPLQRELTMLRQEFDLVDVSEDAAKMPWVLAAEAEDAADAAAAAATARSTKG